MNFVELLTLYKYPFVFIGMFFFGEAVFIPAIYLSFEGQISLSGVLVISVLANIISDFVWYFLAATVPFEKIKKWKSVKGKEKALDGISRLLGIYGYKILFFSKFIYGTRILVQIMCGMKRLNIWKYLAVNTIGTALYLGFLYILTHALYMGVSSSAVQEIKLAVMAFIIILIGINVWIQYKIRKKWLQL
jgi:membrane protein DedA with SNARE-associated domain